MNDNRNKLKEFASNPQNRLVVILGGALGTMIAFLLLSYIFSALNLFGEAGNSVAAVEGAPNIESIPGLGDPSVEYSRLIANQNQQQVEQAEKEGGSSLPTVIRPQYSLNTDAFNEEFHESKVKRDENRCSRENLLKARKSGVSASELKCYGCSAEDLRLAGYTAAELRAAGFSADELKSAGFSSHELRAAGFSAAELRAAGFSAEELLNAGYSVQELLASGFSPKQLLDAGASVAALKAAGVNINSLLADGVNTHDMIESGYCTKGVLSAASNPKQLRLDGVRATELYEGGSSIIDLLDYGYSVREVLDIGVTISQMLAAGVSPSDLRDVGVTKKDVSFAQKNLSQIKGGVCTTQYATLQYNAGVQAGVLWPLGCQSTVLREAGYTARDLVREGVSAGHLRQGGYSASNLVAAGVQLETLVRACFSIDSLLEAGFTAEQLANAGIPVSDLLAYGFSPTELASSGLNCAELYKGGIPVADLYSLGCSPEELRDAGASAAELLAAGYSVSDLRAAGFGVEELMEAGVTAEQLLATGIGPTELLGAGYTEGQLLRAGATADQIFGTSKHHDTGIGCSVERIEAALGEGSTVKDLLDKGCSVDSLAKAGIRPSELLSAGVGVGDLLKSGISISDLVASGVNVDQLIEAKADPRDLYLAGISLEDLKGYTLDQLRAAGYSITPEYQRLHSDISDDVLLISSQDETDLERVQRLQDEVLEKQDRERKVLQLSNAMQAQASALFASWDNLPRQSVNVGMKKPGDYNKSSGGAGNGVSQDMLGPVVKAGTMMYAIVDNSVNSDDPTPVRATIISGPLKGASMLGEFEVDSDKLVLKFTRIDLPTQKLTKDITVFAVDVNTARNVSVDSHYLLKYGSLFASSFLEGMNDVASNIGTTVSTDGQTVTVKEGSLDKTKIIAAGLGKVGKNLVSETKKFQSKPSTIRMHVGATFGILLMEDFMVGLS